MHEIQKKIDLIFVILVLLQYLNSMDFLVDQETQTPGLHVSTFIRQTAFDILYFVEFIVLLGFGFSSQIVQVSFLSDSSGQSPLRQFRLVSSQIVQVQLPLRQFRLVFSQIVQVSFLSHSSGYSSLRQFRLSFSQIVQVILLSDSSGQFPPRQFRLFSSQIVQIILFSNSSGQSPLGQFRLVSSQIVQVILLSDSSGQFPPRQFNLYNKTKHSYIYICCLWPAKPVDRLGRFILWTLMDGRGVL